METLGSILLHEYTHWRKLVAPPLKTNTIDTKYGIFDVRGMDKSKATLNADSYSWYATENFFTGICAKSFQDPLEDDDDDPNCNDTACKATLN